MGLPFFLNEVVSECSIFKTQFSCLKGHMLIDKTNRNSSSLGSWVLVKHRGQSFTAQPPGSPLGKDCDPEGPAVHTDALNPWSAGGCWPTDHLWFPRTEVQRQRGNLQTHSQHPTHDQWLLFYMIWVFFNFIF